jgi:hypothetical protein
LFLGSGAALALLAQAPSDMPGHAALGSSAVCVSCHAADASARWESHRSRPCDPYCGTCHAKEEMAKHHPVGNPVTKSPRLSLRLTLDRKSACFTCHDLSNRRYDSVRWKAESLFGRMFRQEKQHRTYYLATRNDRGQLCLACH